MGDNITIPSGLKTQGIYNASLISLFENKRLYAGIATTLAVKSRAFYIPEITVSDANTHELACSNSIGTATVDNQLVEIGTKTDWSKNYCDRDFDGSVAVGRQAIMAEGLKKINKKVNINFATNVLAGATAVVGTVDLSTQENVSSFLTDIVVEFADYEFEYSTFKDGTITRGKYHGEPFLMAGSVAYAQILKSINSYELLANGKGALGKVVRTPEGIVLINSGTQLGDTKQIVWGVSGVPLSSYMKKDVHTWDIEVNSFTTASADSGDVASGDDILKRTRNMGGEIWEKQLVPTKLQSFVKKQLMA